MRLLPKKPYQVFLLMLLASLVFGLSSYNLFFLFKENLSLVLDYGFMALMDGALQELAMLLLYGIISSCAYIVFKACEKLLVEYLIHKD